MDFQKLAFMPIWKWLIIETLVLTTSFIFGFKVRGLEHMLIGAAVTGMGASLAALISVSVKQYACAAASGHILVFLSLSSGIALWQKSSPFSLEFIGSGLLIVFGFLLAFLTFLLVFFLCPQKWDTLLFDNNL